MDILKRLSWPIRRSLSGKIAVVGALIIILPLVALTAANTWRGQRHLEDQAQQRALDLARLLADGAKDERLGLTEALAASISKQQSVLFAHVLDADDRLLTKSDGSGDRYDLVGDALGSQARRER